MNNSTSIYDDWLKLVLISRSKIKSNIINLYFITYIMIFFALSIM